MRLCLALLAVLALSTACSGGGGSATAPFGGSPTPSASGVAPTTAPTATPTAGAPSATPSVSAPTASPSMSGTAAFSVTVPDAASPTLRGAHYLSPNTKSITIALQSRGGVSTAGPAVTFATTPGSPNCVQGANGLTCSATLTVPGGSDVFAVTTFASPGGVGSMLSRGTASATIPAGGSSPVSVPLTLDGIVSAIALTLTGTFSAGVAATQRLSVIAKDASGATIVGSDPYAMPITLALADPCGAQLSTTVVTSPATAINLTYSGRAQTSTITVAARTPIAGGFVDATLSSDVARPTAGYTSIVVFGDSLSDTGNFAYLTQHNFGIEYPGPSFNYADGLFTDGTNTLPAARCYTGLWIDQFAAALAGKPTVQASLAGGNDHAYAGATTADGTTTSNLPGTSSAVTVENLGQQISDYLASQPKISNKTLFVVWAGTGELLDSSNTTSSGASAAAAREVSAIQRLINAGATDVLVPNIPPIGDFPEYDGTSNGAAQTQAAVSFNDALASDITGLLASNGGRTLRIVPLDVFSLFTSAIESPSAAGLTNVTNGVQDTSGVDPDVYLFWTDVNPTTAGHDLIAADALRSFMP